MLNLSAVDENKDIATKEYADTKALKTEAIKNITRSGTTFTATRCDNTTFTFTQQDNNSVTGVKGNSESSYRTGNVNLTAANVGAIAKNAECLTTNPFRTPTFDGIYISKIDNGLYAADKRWTVTYTGTSVSGSVANLFDGNYESRLQITKSTTGVVLVNFANTTYFPGYPYGYILVSFYYNEQPESVSGRVYCNYSSQGVGWKTISFARVSDSTTTACVYRSEHQGYYNISQMEITVVAGSSSVAGVNQIEIHLDRPHPSYTPFVSKYAAETLYYNLTAPKFIGALQGNADTATNASKVNNLTVQTAVPANAVFTDTKNTAGSTADANKLYLIGAKSQAANPQTYSQANAYITSGKVYSNAKEVVNLSDSQALTNKTYNGYTLGAACAKAVGSVASGDTGLVTGGDVYTAVSNVHGIPAGGSSGQVLAKSSETDYDVGWITPSGGGSGRQSTYYATCSTTAGTAAKAITISDYTPQAGDVLTVCFSTANTANAPTISLNSGTAKAIYVGSAAASSTNQLMWSAGDTLMFVYSGSYWYFVSRAKGDTFVTLYNNTTGTNGTITLSSSAANFDHMRIYFKKSSSQNGCGSVDVYSPNGKYVNLTIFEPDSGSAYLWFTSRTVYINGTSVSTYGSAVGGAIGASTSCGSNTELNIIRIEAWK